jgi:hypothetical protein
MAGGLKVAILEPTQQKNDLMEGIWQSQGGNLKV